MNEKFNAERIKTEYYEEQARTTKQKAQAIMFGVLDKYRIPYEVDTYGNAVVRWSNYIEPRTITGSLD